MSDSSNYQTSYDGIELDANRAFTVEFTPREKQYYIRARITADGFTVVKTIKKTFKTCEHRHGDVDQKTGFCSKCKSQMAGRADLLVRLSIIEPIMKPLTLR